MEEGHLLHQVIEEQFSLGERDLNVRGHCLLEVGWEGILMMRAADWKRWLQAMMLEWEQAEHMEALEQGYLWVALAEWLASGRGQGSESRIQKG